MLSEREERGESPFSLFSKLQTPAIASFCVQLVWQAGEERERERELERERGAREERERERGAGERGARERARQRGEECGEQWLAENFQTTTLKRT